MKVRNLKYGKGDQPEFISFKSTDLAIQTAVYEYNNNCRTFEMDGYEMQIDETGKATGAKKSKNEKKET